MTESSDLPTISEDCPMHPLALTCSTDLEGVTRWALTGVQLYRSPCHAIQQFPCTAVSAGCHQLFSNCGPGRPSNLLLVSNVLCSLRFHSSAMSQSVVNTVIELDVG